MFRRDLKAHDVLADFGDLIVGVIRIVCELAAEADADLPDLLRFFFIGEESDPSEGDDALDVQRPVVPFCISFVHTAERYLVAGLDRV